MTAHIPKKRGLCCKLYTFEGPMLVVPFLKGWWLCKSKGTCTARVHTQFLISALCIQNPHKAPSFFSMQASYGILESRLHIRYTDLLNLKVSRGTGIVKRYSRAWTQRLRCSHMSICIQGPFFKRLYKIINLKLKSRAGDFVSIWLNGRKIKVEYSNHIKSNSTEWKGQISRTGDIWEPWRI